MFVKIVGVDGFFSSTTIGYKLFKLVKIKLEIKAST